MTTMGGGAPMAGAAGQMSLPESDSIDGLKPQEHAFVEKSREASNAASQPEGGKVIGKKENDK